MPRVIHVILPAGTRFQSEFPDGTPDDKILAVLRRNAPLYGTVGVTKATDPKSGLEYDAQVPGSGFLFDHPDTRVVQIEVDDPVKDTVREVAVLSGTAGDAVPPVAPMQSPTPSENRS